MADIFGIEKVWAAIYEGSRQHGDFGSKKVTGHRTFLGNFIHEKWRTSCGGGGSLMTSWVSAQHRRWHHPAYAHGLQAKGNVNWWLLCGWWGVKHLILVWECVETFWNVCQNRYAVFYVLDSLRLQIFCDYQKERFPHSTECFEKYHFLLIKKSRWTCDFEKS